MNAAGLVKDFRVFCLQHADEKNVQKYSRYFKDGVFDSYGVETSYFREKVKNTCLDKSLTPEILFQVAPALLGSPKYEETSYAIALLLNFKKQFTKETFHEVEKWFDTGISNWAHADYFAGDVMDIFWKKGIISLQDLAPWLKSGNKFQRRVVPVSLIRQLKATEDFTPFFKFIEPLMTDPEREVHQGTGWFLREAWKRNKADTEAFLLKWKDVSPRLIYQYACEKMSKEEKGRFRR